MLKSLQEITQLQEVQEQTRTCEACGKQDIQSNMIDVLTNVACPGKGLTGLGCPVQHWSCSLECWSKVAHACIDEHLTPLLKNHRGE